MRLPKPSNDYESAPVGTHLAVCYRLVDLGTSLQETQFGTKKRREVIIGWELPQTLMADGLPFVVNKWYNFSMNKKANLRNDLEAWRGKPFNDEDYQSFDVATILGCSCFISIVTRDDGNTKAGAVTALPKGTPAATLSETNPKQYFSFDDPDRNVFDELPEWLQERIAGSDEFKAWQAGRLLDNELPAPAPALDQVPF